MERKVGIFDLFIISGMILTGGVLLFVKRSKVLMDYEWKDEVGHHALKSLKDANGNIISAKLTVRTKEKGDL